jgi:hypothetical protein
MPVESMSMRACGILAFLKEKKISRDVEGDKIDQSIQVIYRRCKLMKNAILCVTSSIFCSGSLIFMTTLEGLTEILLSRLRVVLLLLSVGLVVAAAVLFVVEVLYSLHAIRIDIEL